MSKNEHCTPTEVTSALPPVTIIAANHAARVEAYEDSAEEVGHPDGQPIIETFPALIEIIAAAIEEDRAQRN